MGAQSNFPTSLDTTSQFPADISATAALNSPNHAEMHERYNDAIIEIEEKIGIGNTTPTANAFLVGDGTGESDWTTTPTFKGDVTVGVDGTGHDVKFYGDSPSHYMLWDQSEDELVLTSDSKLSFHDQGGGENIVASADGHLEVNAGTTLDLTAPTIDLNASTKVNVDGIVDITDTTDSSDATGDTGALRCEGGASIAKKLYVGTNLDVDGTANLDVVDIDGAVDMASTLTLAGLLTANGGLTIQNGDTFTFNTVGLTSVIDSTETWASNNTSIATTGAIAGLGYKKITIQASAPSGVEGDIWIDT